MHLRNQTHKYIYISVYLIGNSDEPNSLMRLGILFLLLRSKKRGMGGSGRNLLKDIGDDRIKVSIVSRMSRWKLVSMVRVNGLFSLLINGIY